MSICTRRAAGITRSVTAGIPCDWIGFHLCREFRTCTMIRVKLPPSATVTRNYARVIIIFRPTDQSEICNFLDSPFSFFPFFLQSITVDQKSSSASFDENQEAVISRRRLIRTQLFLN